MNYSEKFTMCFLLLCLASLLVNSGGCTVLQPKYKKLRKKYAELKRVEFPDALIVKIGETGNEVPHIFSKTSNYHYNSFGSNIDMVLYWDGKGWIFERFCDFPNAMQQFGKDVKSNWCIRAKTAPICPTLVKPEEWMYNERIVRGEWRKVDMKISKAPQCVVDCIMNANPEKPGFDIDCDIVEMGLSAGQILRTLNAVEEIYNVKHRTWPTKLPLVLVQSVLRASNVILLISTFLNPHEFQKFANANSKIRKMRNAYLMSLESTKLQKGSVACCFGGHEHIQVFLKDRVWVGKKAFKVEFPGFGVVKCGDIDWNVDDLENLSLDCELRAPWIFYVESKHGSTYFQFEMLEICDNMLVLNYESRVNEWHSEYRYHKSQKLSFTRAKRIRGEKLREVKKTRWYVRAKIKFPLIRKYNKVCIQEKQVKFLAWHQDVYYGLSSEKIHASLEELYHKTYKSIDDLPIRGVFFRMKIKYN